MGVWGLEPWHALRNHIAMMKFSERLRNNKLLIVLGCCVALLLVGTVALAHKNMLLNARTCPMMSSEETTYHSKSTPNVTGLQEQVDYRLPSYIVPKNYKLLLKPDIAKKTFKGIVSIQIDILVPTRLITLHSHKLNISQVSLKNRNNQSIKVGYNLSNTTDKREFLFVSSKEAMARSPYTLEIQFSGRLDKRIVSIYASTLKNGGTMVASKFQPTYARQAFPCFDEPDFKATYDITLVKPSTHIALSNMNEVSKTIDKETQLETVTFATSVPMSTYLACFVVCDFDFKETEINANGIGRNFRLRTFAQRDQMHKIDFALDIGKRATEYYVKYYEVPFPLPKLDMIAIPDYQSGATEHWGLITYRETSFLVDPATASAQNRYNVANTIAHELAHMWFGNLVTLKWWDDLWLNEGFASYMQAKALNAIEPTWTMLELFLTKTLHSVLVTDAKLSSHPIVQTVDTPDQITAIFDAISYNKATSILRMLEGFIGEENFRKGVSDYLKKYEFGNTVTKDLLNMLEPYFKLNHPDHNLTYILDTWTRQMGYPYLTVAKDEAPNTYVITQSRFLLDPEAKIPSDSPFDYRWFIPITFTTNKGPSDTILWFPNNVQSVKLTLKEDETWLKINNNQVGYYRVNYPQDMWEELVQQLKNKAAQLTISDRAHLINEVFALAQSRRVSYELALNLTTYLTVEEDYVPWEAAAAAFGYLSDMLMGTMAYDDLQVGFDDLEISLTYT
ncbi:hypothetical protein O0L34_g11205 [Tuta absoluta]|nr:hypothetical protein O0L34_g11205 [Tuta absoluta]